MDIDLNEEPSQHEELSQQMVVTKSSRSFLKPPKSKISKRSSKSPSRPNSTKKPPLNIKRHKMVFGKGGIPEGTDLLYKSHGEILRTGYTKDHGIHCHCCEKVVSPSQFEVHAGMGSRKKPYENIFLSNGVSLHKYASSLTQNYENLAKKSDPLCISCQKGRCLSFFHKECIPFKKRFCKHCKSSMKGIKPLKNIEKRSNRTADSPNKDKLVACALCRSYDFSEDGFNDQTVIVCDQCEKEYHIGCLNEHKSAHLTELPSGNWFCTAACERLHSYFKVLLTRGPEKVPDSLMDLIKKKSRDSDTDSITNHDVKWILLCGNDSSEEDKWLLTEAVDIFHDRFNPIIDSVTGSDFIPSMAYGLKMGDSDFSGVYSAMLTIDSKVVTAGMFRILGQEIAELPIVATSQPYQGKGYFQLFLTCFEKLLSYYKIKKLVIPAAKKAKAMWTKTFGFNEVTPEQLREYRETRTSMVYFHRTTLLEKKVPKGQTTAKRGVSFSLNIESP